ncbi:enoyl-CoA hydratase [Bradyrhizobium sp. LHD-71]|uniref:enoyl-CoA hydratase n=1 Tax=Bradyrhizobium sp. LHD-71 TaxID=3072141 RepID=UPI00280EC964|nr:enoyl-CoA hydratase [Bradyrhizobium sp. LHD-71]MDQ8729757.1 enoyl-CoA hydratase [Bradyrhizobium sp. LHD-71]
MTGQPATRTKTYADGQLPVSISEGIGVITFNNPTKLNAISAEMAEGLAAALNDMRDDPEVKVVILTGAGDKAFISGGDISQFEKTRPNAEVASRSAERFRQRQAALADFPKPTIAAIRGYCLGGGLGTALNADIRFASTDAKFGIPAARLGIAYGFEGLNRLVALVGPSRARLILYTGARFNAEEALAFGLIDRLLPPDRLWSETLEIARQIARNAPLAIAAAKITISQILKDAQDRDMGAVREIGRICMDSADFKEGRTAFMEKRPPQFQGR